MYYRSSGIWRMRFLLYTILLPILAVLGIVLWRDKRTRVMAENSEKQKLILEGERIMVDLRACKVVDSSFVRETDKSHTRVGRLDALYDPQRNIKQEEIHHCSILFFRNENEGTKLYESAVICKDKMSVDVLMNRQQYTFLYVDKENRDRYYFDIEFLEK